MMQPNAIRFLPRQAALGLCLVPLLLIGCQLGRSGSELSSLEAQVRDREDRILRLERQVATLQGELEASQAELSQVRRASNDSSIQVLSAEEAQSSFRIKTIEISSLLSGGLDRNDKPGDELLAVLVTPRDGAAEVARADGKIEMTAYDLSRPSQDQRLGAWKFEGAQLRDLWHSGVIGKGFQLTVPWITPPSSNEVLIQCRFITSDGREFSTDAKVRVTPEASESTLSPKFLPSIHPKKLR